MGVMIEWERMKMLIVWMWWWKARPKWQFNITNVWVRHPRAMRCEKKRVETKIFFSWKKQFFYASRLCKNVLCRFEPCVASSSHSYCAMQHSIRSNRRYAPCTLVLFAAMYEMLHTCSSFLPIDKNAPRRPKQKSEKRKWQNILAYF